MPFEPEGPCLWYQIQGFELHCLGVSSKTNNLDSLSSSSLRKRHQLLTARRPSMNGNCAGGPGWLRNLESSCPVENRTVAAHESEESSVVLGGHSPAVPRTEGKDKVLNLVIFKGDYFMGFEGCYVLENVPVSQGSLHWGVCALSVPGCSKGHKFTAEFSILAGPSHGNALAGLGLSLNRFTGGTWTVLCAHHGLALGTAALHPCGEVCAAAQLPVGVLPAVWVCVSGLV